MFKLMSVMRKGRRVETSAVLFSLMGFNGFQRNFSRCGKTYKIMVQMAASKKLFKNLIRFVCNYETIVVFLSGLSKLTLQHMNMPL